MEGTGPRRATKPPATEPPTEGAPRPVGPPSRRVIATMTVATGAIVANLYYAQPLEDTLARHFDAPPTALGLIITIFQVGYAIGLATILPLGDLLERRRLLAALLSVVVVGMMVMALAPSLAVFGSAAAVVGLTSVAVQVIVPFAAHLSAGPHQGRVVSIVMSGLLIGILVSRTVAGLVAELLGWRAVFALGAVATAIVAGLLWRVLPTLAPTTHLRYPRLVASVGTLIRDEPVLRMRMFYGALTFASFSAFWTSAAFLLAAEPYSWNDAEIGAFALLGVAGALMAQVAGRLADRDLARPATGVFLVVLTASYALIGLGGHHLLALALGVLLMDMGSQGTHISNQGLIFRLRPEARSRLNTAYMVSYFAGGAAGSASSAAMFHAHGWTGVCVLGAAFPALALLGWIAEAIVTARRPPGATSDRTVEPVDTEG